MSELYGVRDGLIRTNPIKPRFKYNLWEVTLQLPTGTANVIIKGVGVTGAVEEAINYYKMVCDLEANPIAIAVYSYPDKEKVWWI